MRIYSDRFLPVFVCDYVLYPFVLIPLCSHPKVPKVFLGLGRRGCLALSKNVLSSPHNLWFCGLAGSTRFGAKISGSINYDKRSGETDYDRHYRKIF